MLIFYVREIRPFRGLPAQWSEGLQITDKEENCQSGLERELRIPSGMSYQRLRHEMSLSSFPLAISLQCRFPDRGVRLESDRAGKESR